MDREDARFILRCFRPDGEDAENPDFAEALACVAKDRELGEWLARERACDAAFAAALNSVNIPGELRETLFLNLSQEQGDGQIPPDELDERIMGALSEIQPPARMRREILSAMHRTPVPPTQVSRWWRWGVPTAAAAGIALAFLTSRQEPGDLDVFGSANPGYPMGSIVPASATLPISKVEEEFIRTFESPGFKLDLNNPDHHALFDHLKSAKLPCPSRCLPKGLKEVPGLGCRELEIDGKKGSLVSFKQREEVVHLVVFKRRDVKCGLSKTGKPDFGQNGKWSVARWTDDDWVFVLLADKTIDRKRLEEMF